MRNRNLLISIVLIVLVNYSVKSQINNCIYCVENVLGLKSSAIGYNNLCSGDYSLTVGSNNTIAKNVHDVVLMGNNNVVLNSGLGNYSGAWGINNHILSEKSYIIGYQDTVSGTGAIAIGTGISASGLYSLGMGLNTKSHGNFSAAIGNRAISSAMNSYSFGNFVWSQAQGAITIGIGLSTYMKNNIPYSIMVGSNSDLPTLFVSASTGAGTTGKIGIGNMTSPTSKLHIKGDLLEDVTIRLEPANTARWAKLLLGNNGHCLSTRSNEDLIFTTQTGKSFSFANGNIKQTAGYYVTTDKIKGLGTDGLLLYDNQDKGISIKNGGQVAINSGSYEGNLTIANGGGTWLSLKTANLANGSWLIQNPGEQNAINLLYSFNGGGSDDLTQILSCRNNGDVTISGKLGIGVNPTQKLDVAGTIKGTGFQLFNGQQGQGKVIQSDANGFFQWVEQSSLDDGDWIKSGNDIHRLNGNVGIGIVATSEYSLSVAGKIHAEEVMVEHADNWYDFVFDPAYALQDIYDLEKFICENKHLPGVPSEKEVQKNGINVGEMNGVLLQKIEELTLYIIQQQKEIDDLKNRIR